MNRRSLLRLTQFHPVVLLDSHYLKALQAHPEQPLNHREQAQRLNELAANIHTLADSRAFVDFVANIFASGASVPMSRALRERVAEAEFFAATDPQKQIPEQRIADAWNSYTRTIQAPAEPEVTAAEIHELRRGFLYTATYFWSLNSQNFWEAPSIYATGLDGKIAEGCRAIESIRVLWDLANMPTNLTAARTRIAQGTPASGSLSAKENAHPQATHRVGVVSFSILPADPVEVAQRQYIANHGIHSFSRAVLVLVTDALG